MPNDRTTVIVEDDPTDAALINRALNRNGLADEVIFLRDGQAALRCFGLDDAGREEISTAKPRVVVLDLKLPKVSGLDVLKTMKEDDEWCCVPIVVLTSSSDPGDIEKAYTYGANSYVVKPVEAAAFHERITCLFAYWLSANQPEAGKN